METLERQENLLNPAKFSSLKAVDEMDITRRTRRVLSTNNSENAPVTNNGKGLKDIIKSGISTRQSYALGLRKNNVTAASKAFSKPDVLVFEKPKLKHPVASANDDIPQVCSISKFPLGNISTSSVSADCFDDQHKHLLYLERCRGLPSNFLENKSITGKMRYVLFDWMLQVLERFSLQQDTLHLAYLVVDCCLYRMNITKDKLQLLGSTALFLASKYEEVSIPHIQDFIFLAASSFTMRELTQMEREVFRAINFNMGYAYPLHFLRRYRYVLQNDDVTHPLSKMFCDVFMCSYELAHKLPSKKAQVALYLAYFVMDHKLPAEVYPLMGTTPEDLKKECSEYIDAIILFCTSPKELTLHRKYFKEVKSPRLSPEQQELLKSLKRY